MRTTRQHSLYIGFHGCEKSLARSIVLKETDMTPSTNPYDWLGHGIYFWENDPKRAVEFARDVKGCVDPFVIGAVLDLGYCFDLTCRENLMHLKNLWSTSIEASVQSGDVMLNKPGRKKCENGELMLRYLDCRMITAMHNFNKDHKFQPFDSVRAAFWEGEELYPTAGFMDKSHIQICICNPECILGLFIPDGYRV